MLVKIEVLSDISPIAVVNPAFIQHLRCTTKYNSTHPDLIDKSYTTVTMADGCQFRMEMSIGRVMEILTQQKQLAGAQNE